MTDERAEPYLNGDRAWPVSYQEWEQRAEEVLRQRAYDYVAGGAGDESTVHDNRAAFSRWRLRPRMLTGNSTRDLSVDILGLKAPAPVFLAPVGVQSILHPDAELPSARAAAAVGLPFITSSCASLPMEEIADASGDASRWYQLYWVSDREVAASFVQRAEASGYGAIVLTLDTLTLGWRHRDLRNAYLPFAEGVGIGQFTSDPVFRSKLAKPPEEDPRGAGTAMLEMFQNLELTWDDIAWLRERTSLPILLKGVLRGDDAKRGLDAGADGIIVSNHGGRQVAGAIASLDALVDVRDTIGPETPVLVDGGVREGSDILKALALGANAVLIGRPYVYALAVAGQAGVEQFLRSLLMDLDATAALAGVAGRGDLNRELVTKVSA
jgi:isopentenyl diphosphate isomerase/L-lactate dehydrogenase-like FMN-dependent dehydrogenase